MRRFVALVLALSLLSSGISGCSQPIDNGSSVPAQSQPIVALLALLGVGIALTALHHHRELHPAGGGGAGPTIFPAQISIPPFAGFTTFDLAADSFNGTLGALLVPSGGSGTGKFTEFFSNSTPFGTYTLPAGYAPVAVAMDSGGTAWFVDAAGKVQGCGPMTAVSTICLSQGTFNDGLGSGKRSIAVDVNFIVVVVDAGSGKVKWWAKEGSPPATGTNTYSPSTTSPIFSSDAIELVTTPPSGFTVYHQDGSSDFITFGVSGSSLTINNQPNFKFNPAPLTALSNLQSGAKTAFYAFTGTPTASYFLTKYETPGPIGLVNPTVTSELIEFNGQEDPNGVPFTSPLSSVHYDAIEGFVWAIDKNGNVVSFLPF